MSSTVPTLTLRSAGDLVAALPYLLGYQPRDALVLVCLRGGQVCMTAHQPLPPDGEPPLALDPLMAGMAKADPEAVIVLGYQNEAPVTGVLRQAAAVCAEVGVRVQDQIIVTPDGWQSLDPDAPTAISPHPPPQWRSWWAPAWPHCPRGTP